jgi:hypothetical protein
MAAMFEPSPETRITMFFMPARIIPGRHGAAGKARPAVQQLCRDSDRLHRRAC